MSHVPSFIHVLALIHTPHTIGATKTTGSTRDAGTRRTIQKSVGRPPKGRHLLFCDCDDEGVVCGTPCQCPSGCVGAQMYHYFVGKHRGLFPSFGILRGLFPSFGILSVSTEVFFHLLVYSACRTHAIRGSLMCTPSQQPLLYIHRSLLQVSFHIHRSLLTHYAYCRQVTRASLMCARL